jgi:hypothetical protein
MHNLELTFGRDDSLMTGLLWFVIVSPSSVHRDADRRPRLEDDLGIMEMIDRLSKKSMLVIAKERNVPRFRRPEPSNDSEHERIAIEIAMDFYEKPSQTVEESTEVEAVPRAAAGIVDDGRRSSSEMNRYTIE